MPSIIVDGLSCAFGRSPAEHSAVNQVSLEVRQGEFVIVTGPNGSGKSTLLACISGVVPNLVSAKTCGNIIVQGQDISQLDRLELSTIFGVVLDDPDSQLFGSTVFQYLAFGLEVRGIEPEESLRRVREAGDLVGITGLLPRNPSTLSGGEKQRAVIASMLVNDPPILILDEPTSQLDPTGTEEIVAAVRGLNRDRKITCIVATHKISEFVEFADKILLLDRGTVKAFGPSREILGRDFRSSIRYPQATQFFHACREAGIEASDPMPVTVGEGAQYVDRLMARSL